MKKLNILTLTMIALGFALTFGAPRSWAQTGVDNNTVFELDGNTQDNPALSGLDWEGTFPPATPRTSPFPIQDPAGVTIFTTGGSKDINDVSQWRHKNGSVPDKDNILQAVAAAFQLPAGGTAIYFAASRFDNSGDAQIGLWFFQQEVAPQANGTFGPAPGQLANHTDGDLLLLVNFEGGGLVPTIQAYKWQGGVNGGPVLAGNLITGECGVGPNAGNFDACAITNAAASTAPVSWNYVPKSGTPGIFPPQTFFEGGIKLSAIFGANVPCFSSFLAETRSSSSITATLKDFAEGSFDLCSIDVSKTCEFVGVVNGGTELQYRFSGSVTNNGAGTVYDVQVVDTASVSGTQNPANPITVAASIAPGASANWGPVLFTTAALSFTNQALAQAASSPGGLRTVTDTVTGVSCQGAVNSSIAITKDCIPGASLLDIGSQLVVQVGVSGTVTNNGNTSLSGITLADIPSATITFDGVTPLAPGGTRNWSATYQPAAVDSLAPCNFADTIRVTAATPAIGPSPSPVAGCPNPNDLACAGASCPLCPSTP
jgi:hypothetical protein